MVETLLWLLLPAVICGTLVWLRIRSSRRDARARYDSAAPSRRRDDPRPRAGSRHRPDGPARPTPSPWAPPRDDVAGTAPPGQAVRAPGTAVPPAAPGTAAAPAPLGAPGTPPSVQPLAGSPLPRRPRPGESPRPGASPAARSGPVPPVWASASRLPATTAPSWGPRSTWASMTRRPRTPPPPDPFETLTVQVRLGVLASQVRALDADPHVYGRGRRLFATQAAYDELLAEACRMAGVEVEENPGPGQMRSEPERFREEMELAARGWSW